MFAIFNWGYEKQHPSLRALCKASCRRLAQTIFCLGDPNDGNGNRRMATAQARFKMVMYLLVI